MSQTLDANILLFASDRDSARRARAEAFITELVQDGGLVYLFWPTVLAYLRIATHASIFRTPLDRRVAVANIDRLLAYPNVRTVGEGGGFWPSFRDVAEDADARGNLVPDAHVVSLMLENGVRTIWTHDRDFRRFSEIVVRDPFSEPLATTS